MIDLSTGLLRNPELYAALRAGKKNLFMAFGHLCMAFGQLFPGLLRNPVHLAALRAD